MCTKGISKINIVSYRIVLYCNVPYTLYTLYMCLCIYVLACVCARERESMCVCVVATSGGFVVWCFFYLLRLVDDVEFDTGRRGGGNSGLRQQGHGAVIINSSWC